MSYFRLKLPSYVGRGWYAVRHYGFSSLFLNHAVDYSIYPAVFLPTLGRVIVTDAPGVSVPLGRESHGINAEIFHQVVHHIFRTLLRELHVVLGVAVVVGVPLNECRGGW